MTDDERAAVLRFDTEIYEAARVLAQASPLDLHAWHFEQLALVSPRIEAAARAAQELAMQTKAAPVVTAPETLEAFLQKHGQEPATYEALHVVFNELLANMKTMNARNIERNTKIAALEARVLELEAAHAAARPVQHADR